jgi:SAM-dependent methyltransferase
VPEWPPALDGVVEKLQRGAHVADVGCGHGHSTVLMASAFERSRFVGFDTQDDSLERARAHAEAAAVSERVEFRRGDASSYPSADYDPDLLLRLPPRPRRPGGGGAPCEGGTCRGRRVDGRRALCRGHVADNVGTVARLYYSGSTVLCVPHSRSEEVGLALGAQAGPARLSAVFREAGFRSIRVAHQTPFNIVLDVRP